MVPVHWNLEIVFRGFCVNVSSRVANEEDSRERNLSELMFRVVYRHCQYMTNDGIRRFRTYSSTFSLSPSCFLSLSLSVSLSLRLFLFVRALLGGK